jgi:hypothetical protein
MSKHAHAECLFGYPCELERPDECPPAIARAKREHGRPWSSLTTRREPGGLRHYLEGKAVHCGDGLELQHVAPRFDDYGEYSQALQLGAGVRYEASFDGARIKATVHADVGGHEFVARLDESMRFRWPQ